MPAKNRVIGKYDDLKSCIIEIIFFGIGSAMIISSIGWKLYIGGMLMYIALKGE